MPYKTILLFIIPLLIITGCSKSDKDIKDSPLVGNIISFDHSIFVLSNFSKWQTKSTEAKRLNRLGTNINSIISCVECDDPKASLDRYFKPKTEFKIIKHTKTLKELTVPQVNYVVLEHDGYQFAFPETRLKDKINYTDKSDNDKKTILFETALSIFQNNNVFENGNVDGDIEGNKEIYIVFDSGSIFTKKASIDKYKHLYLKDGHPAINEKPILKALKPYNLKRISTNDAGLSMQVILDQHAMAYLVLRKNAFDIRSFLIKTGSDSFGTPK